MTQTEKRYIKHDRCWSMTDILILTQKEPKSPRTWKYIFHLEFNYQTWKTVSYL